MRPPDHFNINHRDCRWWLVICSCYFLVVARTTLQQTTTINSSTQCPYNAPSTIYQLYRGTANVAVNSVLNVSDAPFDTDGITNQPNSTLTAFRASIQALVNSFNVTSTRFENIPAIIRNFFSDVSNIGSPIVAYPPGNVTALGVALYYTTTLGKMSQAELVARYSVQTLLGLFLNTAMPLNFTQDVVFLPGNVTFARTVQVKAPVSSQDEIISTQEACNGVLHTMTGILLPMERYNASMFYTVPSSPAVVNVTLQHWNASMLQNTYIPPAVAPCPYTIMDLLLVDTRFSMLGAAVQSIPDLYNMYRNTQASLSLFLPIDGTFVFSSATINMAYPDALVMGGLDMALKTGMAWPMGLEQEQIMMSMLSLTVMGGTSMGGLLANASNTNGYLTTLLSLVPNLPTRNITTIKNTTVPASGDMVWISNATSLGEPVVGRTPAVVNDMVVGPDGYIPFPARVVSTIYTCNGPVYVLSGSMVFAENTVMPSDEDVDAASAYLQSLQFPIPGVLNAQEGQGLALTPLTPPLVPLTPAPAPTADSGSSGVPVAAIVVPVVVGVVLLAAAVVGVGVWKRKKGVKGGGSLESGGDDKGGYGAQYLESIQAPDGGSSGDGTTTEDLDASCVLNPLQVEVIQDSQGNPIVLGRGGFGEVYRGVLYGTTPVAVKYMLHCANQEQTRRQLIKEIQLLKNCRNQHIVQFYGASLARDKIMLVTELMPGGDLFRALHGSPDGVKYLWRNRGKFVLLDIIRGLSYLHGRAQPIIHCDIKTPNILLSAKGNAKISDLGMSRVMLTDHVTKSENAMLGTWNWAAPELLTSHTVTEKVDIFSFGIILYEVVTGEMPLRGNLRKFEVPDECPAAIQTLFHSCTAADPDDRPTARDTYELLVAAIKGTGHKTHNATKSHSATASGTNVSSSAAVAVQPALSAPTPGSSASHNAPGPMGDAPPEASLQTSVDNNPVNASVSPFFVTSKSQPVGSVHTKGSHENDDDATTLASHLEEEMPSRELESALPSKLPLEEEEDNQEDGAHRRRDGGELLVPSLLVAQVAVKRTESTPVPRWSSTTNGEEMLARASTLDSPFASRTVVTKTSSSSTTNGGDAPPPPARRTHSVREILLRRISTAALAGGGVVPPPIQEPDWLKLARRLSRSSTSKGRSNKTQDGEQGGTKSGEQVEHSSSQSAPLLAFPAEKQLEIAHKVVLHAFRTRVTSLEAHVTHAEQQTTSLRAHVAALESKLHQAQQQVQAQQQQHTTLEHQNTALIQTIKDQQRTIARLQGFRDTLMQSLNAATNACDTTNNTNTNTSDALGDPTADLCSQQLIQAALASAAAAVSPTTAGGAPPRGTPCSPTFSYTMGGGSPCPLPLHSGHHSQQKCCPDGKAFFSECRQRLSYEAFGEFLAVVKRFNSGQCSRQEALCQAGGVLGAQHVDLLATINVVTSPT